MKKSQNLILVLSIGALMLFGFALIKQKLNTIQTSTAKDSNGLEYDFIDNNKIQTRQYTLKNGMEVFMMKNGYSDKVRLDFIVKSGSNSEVRNQTGAANYLKDIVLLGMAATSYKPTRKKHKRKRLGTDTENGSGHTYGLYKELDILYRQDEGSMETITNKIESGTAQVTGEYTKFTTQFRKGLTDEYLAIQSKAITKPNFKADTKSVVDSIHKNFNALQSSASYQLVRVSVALLFPDIPRLVYGVIGNPRDIMSPKISSAQAFYKKHYISNNMSLVLSGDVDFDKHIKLIKRHFESIKPMYHKNNTGARLSKPLRKIVKYKITLNMPNSTVVGFKIKPEDMGKVNAIGYLMRDSSITPQGSKVDTIFRQVSSKNAIILFRVRSDEQGKQAKVNDDARDNNNNNAIQALMRALVKVKDGKYEAYRLERVNTKIKIRNSKIGKISPGVLALNGLEKYMTKITTRHSVTQGEMSEFINGLLNSRYIKIHIKKGLNEKVSLPTTT